MTRREALYQSLAACGAALITFIGVCHEFVGETLFPWAVAFLFPWAPAPLGEVMWHAMGVSCFLTGLLLLAATLQLGFPRLPVRPIALTVSVAAVGVAILVAVTHHQFHMFAVALAVSGVVTAVFHRKALAEEGR